MICSYRIEGDSDAPVLVLLHAIATDSEMWAPQMPVWASAFRVLRIDLPGHGGSAAPTAALSMEEYADAVMEVIRSLGIVRVDMAGLSLGGMVAQAFALKYPAHLRSLVLAHTSARTDAAVFNVWETRIAQFEQEGMEAQIAPTLERWFTRDFALRSPMTMAWLANTLRRTSAEGYVAAMRAIQHLDHLDQLPRIAHRTLVVAGEADTAVPPAIAGQIAQRLPNATLWVLEQAAHVGNIEQATAFTERIGAFLQDV